MISTKQTTKKFWTKGRLALTCAASLSAVALASSCTSTDTARDGANGAANNAKGGKPVVTVTQQRGQPPPPAPPNPAQSDTLSPEVMNAEIETLDGKTIRLADYKNKVVVLDLWATWCGPCRLEIPHLVEMSKEYASKDVEVLGLTTENPQTDEQKVRAFAREYSINYTLGWATGDLASKLMRGNYSIPQTFVIAPGGRVVAHYRGFSQNLPTMIRAALDKATDKTTGD
ncbi:MAG: TlpA family protein disulfide reductase [Acidobacteria bacterium]|nr:TlpA family protein disulfide reductase [Acidobacteriota bacterium]